MRPWSTIQQPTPMQEAMAVERWNAAHPIGTAVAYFPIANEATHRDTRTRSAAWLMGGHTAGVLIEWQAGGVSPHHIQPTGPEPAAAPIAAAVESEAA